jgi:chromate transporter
MKSGGFSEVFLAALRLGLTSFGGPIAHIGYFRREYVARRAWLSDGDFAEILALCQLLPGPTSSQVGMAIGAKRGGIPGALAAFLGFTTPSALLMIGFAAVVHLEFWPASWIHGLKLVALAVVAHAAFSMARVLIRTHTQAAILICSMVLLWQFSTAWLHIVVLCGAGLAGAALGADRTRGLPLPASPGRVLSKRAGAWHLALLVLLLLLMPWIASMAGLRELTLVDIFLRIGSLVFGGGHVVLPLLQKELVEAGLMNGDRFLAGYSAAQAMPGPLFTIAAFAGMEIGGILAALLCLLAIFLPGYLLVLGLLPFWESLRTNGRFQGAAAAMNASVVGLIALAVYDPLWKSAVFSAADGFVAGLLLCLAFLRIPPVLIVAAGLLIGSLLHWAGLVPNGLT